MNSRSRVVQRYISRKKTRKKSRSMPGGINRVVRQELKSTSSQKRVPEPTPEQVITNSNYARIRRGVEFEARKWGPLSKDKFNRLYHGARTRWRELSKLGVEREQLKSKLVNHEMALQIKSKKKLLPRDWIILKALRFSRKADIPRLKLVITYLKLEIDSIHRLEKGLYEDAPPSFERVFNSSQTAQLFWATIRQFVSPHVEHPQFPPPTGGKVHRMK